MLLPNENPFQQGGGGYSGGDPMLMLLRLFSGLFQGQGPMGRQMGGPGIPGFQPGQQQGNSTVIAPVYAGGTGGGTGSTPETSPTGGTPLGPPPAAVPSPPVTVAPPPVTNPNNPNWNGFGIGGGF